MNSLCWKISKVSYQKNDVIHWKNYFQRWKKKAWWWNWWFFNAVENVVNKIVPQYTESSQKNASIMFYLSRINAFEFIMVHISSFMKKFYRLIQEKRINFFLLNGHSDVQFFFSIVLCAWLGFDLFLIDLFGKLDTFRHQIKWAGVSICLVLIIWWKRSCWWPIIRMKSSIFEFVQFALDIQPFAQHDMAFCYAIGFLAALAYFGPCCVNLSTFKLFERKQREKKEIFLFQENVLFINGTRWNIDSKNTW